MKKLTTHTSEDVLLKYFDGTLPDAEGVESGETIKVLVCDVETTGLDKSKDVVIELGAVMVELTKGDYEFVKVLDSYNCLQDPGFPLPEEIIRVTGITDMDVKDQKLDLESLRELVRQSDLIACHNSNFDRTFLEKTLDEFASKPFACSLKEVDWRSYGFASQSLGVLMMEMGMVGSAHRAEGDCRMTARILIEKNELEGGDGKTFFSEMIENAKKLGVFVKAIAAFEEKDILKSAGFFWNGDDRFWGIEVAKDELPELDEKLKEAGFTGKLEIVKEVTAVDRYK